MKHLLRSVLAVFLLALPLTLSAQTARTILIEEFSGDWCGYCPYGADTISTILSQCLDVRALSYHGGSASEPLQTTEGNGVISKIGLQAWPQASIDRIIWNLGGGNYQRCLSRPNWRPAITVRGSGGNHLSPCTVGVSGTFDPNTREIDVTMTVDVLVDMTGAFNFNIVLSEDNINLRQKFYPASGGSIWLDPYAQQHVVRKMITGTDGVSKTTSGFTSGQQITHNITYTIPQSWNLLDLHLTAFVSKMTGNNFLEIQQTLQEPMLNVLTATPVELKSFLAQSMDNGIYLTWTTAKESNNKGWFIERRSDGADWTTLAFVDGKGTTAEDHFYSFTDETPEYGNIYTYRLKQVDYDGSYEYSPKMSVAYDAAPATTQLHQNFPNPFNPSTEIAVDLAADTDITLEVHDAMGRLIATLADGRYKTGTVYFNWDGTDLGGARVPAGMYFYRLTTPAGVTTKQMILAK